MKRLLLIGLMVGMMGAAKPTTRPTTFAEAMALVSKLQAEVDSLRAENRDLRNRIEEGGMATTRPSGAPKIGMTLSEATDALSEAGLRRRERSCGIHLGRVGSGRRHEGCRQISGMV